MRHLICTVLFLFALSATVPTLSWADPPGTLLRTYLNPDRPDSPNQFGWDIATYKDTFFASDPFTPEGGAVYQFDRNGTLLRKIYYSGTTQGPRFGDAIHVVGDHLVVGATWELVGGTSGAFASGSVFVYSAVTGAFERRIDSPSPAGPFQTFGESFAHVGNQLIIGNSNHSVPMFNVDTGALVREFPNLTPDSTFFGEQVAALGNQVYIAAPQQGHTANAGNGIVYVFDRNTGGLIRSMGQSLSNASRLGSALFMSGSDLLAGDSGFGPPNSAYVFDDATGALLRTLNQPPESLPAFWGTPVSSMGGFDLVSAFTFQVPSSVDFFNSVGNFVFSIPSPVQSNDPDFGTSLAPFGNDLLVGAPGGALNGRVYLFTTPVPEPSALGLACLGFVALLGLQRRSRFNFSLVIPRN